MPCSFPVQGYFYSDDLGKRFVPSDVRQDAFRLGIPLSSNNDPVDAIPMAVPCGRCGSCRMLNARNWGIRCMHEAQTATNSLFLTLTYDPAHLPSDRSLNLEHFKAFMKRLRRRRDSRYIVSDSQIRYLHCGEYGDRLGRPHYHALVYGTDFLDKELISLKGGHRLYNSSYLDSIWTHGFVGIGAVSFQSAAYVARYSLKKVHGDLKEDHYQGRKIEYATMSKKPGIGFDFFQKFYSEIYPSDEVVVDSVDKRYVVTPPRYYDKLLKAKDVELYDEIKHGRYLSATKVDWTERQYNRLQVKMKCAEASYKKLIRSIDQELGYAV